MPKKILLVEDEVLIAMNEAQTLEKHGYEVVSAHKGEEAVEMVNTDPEISLILMDIDLGSGMDGTEAAEKILTKKDIPVVFLSSHTEPEVVEKTEKITSYGYVVKNSGVTVLDTSIKMAFKLFDTKNEARKHEQSQRQSEKRYRAIVEAFDGLIYVCSQDYHVEFMNERFIERTGYDGTGELCYKALHNLESVCPWCVNNSVFKGETVRWEVLSPKDNRWYYVVDSPIYHDDGSMSKQAMIMDITERRQAEEKLRLKSRFIDRIAEVSPDIFIIYNEEGEFLEIITANEDYLFLKREMLMGSKIPEVLPETAASRIMQGIDGALTTNSLKVVEYELEIENKRLYFEARITPLEEDKVLAQIIEITERKQTEDALRESEKKNSAILYAFPDLMFIQDSAGTYLDYYASNEDYLYVQPERFIGQKMQDILPKEIYQHLFPLIEKTLATNEVQKGEYELALSGDKRAYEARFSPFDEDRVVAITRDITELKRAEESLQEANLRLTTVIDGIDAVVYISDMETYEIIFINEYGRRIFGDIAGLKCWKTIQGQDGPCVFCTNDKLVDKDGNPTGIFAWEHQNTLNGRWYDCRDSAVQWYDGRIVRIEVATDITARKQLEEQLKKSEERFKTIFYNSEVSLWEEDFSEVRDIIEDLKEKGVKDFNRYFDENPNAVFDFAKKIKVIDINDATLRLYGAKTKEEMLGSLDKTLYLTDNTYDILKDEFVAIAEKRTSVKGEMKTKSLYGKVIDITMSVYLSNEKDIKVVAINDITPYKRAIEEKEFLMKELNHRVKNNLAMVSSLINLKDSEIESDLSDLKSRIDVIKLVHEKLHQHNDVEHIEVKEYFQELLESIFYSTSRGTVQIINNAEDISILTKIAIPLGLLVNEIATNAIKYGFNDNEEARFSVDMRKEADRKHYILTLSNSGNPFPEKIELESPETMGLQLVSTLVAQLNGTIKLKKKPNPVFTIRFPLGEE